MGEIDLMNNNLCSLINAYCEAERSDFESHELYIELYDIASEMNYTIKCEYGKGATKDVSRNLYLCISIYDHDNQCIEIYDDGFLSASTELVLIDRKGRIRFCTWDDEDFLDSIHWMIRKLQEIKCQKNAKVLKKTSR